MNNTFNTNRFMLLFKKQTMEHLKTYLMSLGVLAGIMALLFVFVYYVNDGKIYPQIQQVVFLNFMLLSGTIFTSMIFADLGDKKKAIPLLTLPVSHFEKYLVAWIYSFMIFLTAFVILFYAVDATAVSLGNLKAVVKNPVINVFSTNSMIWTAFPVYAALHSICFTGAIFFEKLHFIKTAFSFFLILIIVSLINYPLVRLIFNVDVENAPPFTSVRVNIDHGSWQIEPTHSSSIIAFIMIILVALVLWASAYFKLKEKEV
jgi:hypothetical protein